MANTLGDIVVNLTLNVSQFNRSIQQVQRNLNNATRNISSSAGNMSNSVGQSTNSISNSLDSVLHSSRVLVRNLGTDFEDQRRIIGAAGREFHNFASIGRRVPHDIAAEFSALPRHLQQYVSRLRDAGQSTEEFQRLNQMYGARIIDQFRRTNDYMQNRTTQSQRLMRSFAEDTNLAPLTNGFLSLGHRMERTAAQGTVLSIALQRIGNNNNLRNLQDQMRFIQQGIMRARGAFLVFGIASLLAFGGMIKLASAVDKRVAPAFDNLKKTWLGAMMPFIKTFANGMLNVMNFVTAIGKMVGAFSKAHPAIFSMIMSILMLTLVLGAILSPLAVTGIMAEGVAASFAALWTMVAPFVLGFLAVIGVALALATALVVLYVSIKMMWKQSEVFRNAFINLWNGIKDAFYNNFLTPILSAWNYLKQSFGTLVSTMTGGKATGIGSFFKWLGDIIGKVVNVIALVILPIFQLAFQIAGQVVAGVINLIGDLMGWLAGVMGSHGGQIQAVIGIVWKYIVLAFTTVGAFIKSIMPVVSQTITMAFALIKQIIVAVVTFIAPFVIGAFKLIAAIVIAVWPYIVTIIKLAWESIKGLVISGINIIQGVIKLFSNILKGNWKGAWENVKSIVVNIFVFIWNYVNLMLIGKVFKIVGLFSKGIINFFKIGLSGAWNIVKTVLTTVGKFFVEVFKGVLSFLKITMTGLVTLVSTGFGFVKDAIVDGLNAAIDWIESKFPGIGKKLSGPIETAKDTIVGILEKIKSAFTKLVLKIPKPHIPKISIGWSKIGKGKMAIDVPSIKWNASGNIFKGASLLGGGQGVGEAGAEVVMPINRKRYMKPYASMVASMLPDFADKQQSGPNQYNIHFNEPVVVREDADIQKIAVELEKRQRQQERAKGILSFRG